jgi:hypothetical protein
VVVLFDELVERLVFLASTTKEEDAARGMALVSGR